MKHFIMSVRQWRDDEWNDMFDKWKMSHIDIFCVIFVCMNCLQSENGVGREKSSPYPTLFYT